MATQLINKVTLDFSFPAEEKDNALQQTKDLFYEKLLPVISADFDKVDGMIRIEKLEIDLGKTTVADIESDFINEFKSAFKKYFVAPRPATAGSFKHATLSISGTAEENTDDAAEAFFYFLQKGYWPWNFQQKDSKELEAFTSTIIKNETPLRRLLTRLQSAERHVAERLIRSIPATVSVQSALINVLHTIHPAFKALTIFLPASFEKNIFKEETFYFFFLAELIVSAPVNDEEAMVQLLEKMVDDNIITIPEEIIQEEKPAFFLEQFFAAIEEKQSSPSTLLKQQSRQSKVETETLEQHNNIYNENEPEKISVNNAGLVLFHPFLKAVFADLGWTGGDKKFIHGNAQRKAVLFLQYLVNGKSRQPEHLLVLNKILCDWPVHLPLPSRANFSAKEKNAANDLIESLKEHWPVMKNTTNRGLVESFVQRPGLIQRTDKGFIVQVERKSIDILLDSLPFNLNLIKLPWNEQIIYTEW